MTYPQAYAAFVAALDDMEAAAATLQAAELSITGRPLNPVGRHLVSLLETARVGRSVRLPELRRVLAP